MRESKLSRIIIFRFYGLIIRSCYKERIFRILVAFVKGDLTLSDFGGEDTIRNHTITVKERTSSRICLLISKCPSNYCRIGPVFM